MQCKKRKRFIKKVKYAEENQYGSKNTKIKWQKKPLETA